MSQQNLIATATIAIDATKEQVWDALVNPETIEKYMFGAKVDTDWQEGSTITWRGDWKGKPYEDKGKILHVSPNKALQYTHYSPLTGEEDVPANYHTVSVALSEDGDATRVTLTQDGNKNEEGKAHSEKNWAMMLESMKNAVEKAN